MSSPPSPQSDDHFQAVALLGTGGQFAARYGYQLSPMMEQRGSAQPGDRGSVRCFVNGGVRISEANRDPLVESEAQRANLLYPGQGCPRAAEPCLPLFLPGVADGVSHCRQPVQQLGAQRPASGLPCGDQRLPAAGVGDERSNEPFSTCVELAVLEDVDGLGQVTGSVRAAT